MQTFKVGDWIVEPNGNKVRLNEVPEPGSYYAEDCVLWQPQPGELVILKDKHGIISVIKYNGEPNVYPFIGEITWLHKKD